MLPNYCDLYVDLLYEYEIVSQLYLLVRLSHRGCLQVFHCLMTVVLQCVFRCLDRDEPKCNLNEGLTALTLHCR